LNNFGINCSRFFQLYSEGKGYGKLLLNHVLKDKKKYSSIETEVKIENINVINVLMKNGFNIKKYDQDYKEYIFKLENSNLI
jgi:ribosomal protein S18 acetylase RimI-like enzyme